MSPQKAQPSLNRHVVAVVDGLIYHYDVHNGMLYKYQLQYLMGNRQEETNNNSEMKNYILC